MKNAVLAAEGAVEQARQRLVQARAVLSEVRAIEAQHRSLLIAAGPGDAEHIPPHDVPLDGK